MTHCLVFDLGAGSGRAMLAHFDGARIAMSEVHRFSGIEMRLGDGPHWDLERLLAEIEAGVTLAIRRCGTIDSIGVDSWGVDYALVDRNGQLESSPHHYRHARSQRGYDAFPMSPVDLALRSGAQALPVNTVYQLFSASRDAPETLTRSRHALMIADAVNYHLSGTARSNATLARTTGMLAASGQWDTEICVRAGIDPALLAPIAEPGSIVGQVRPEVKARLGLVDDVPVIAVAGHDTASAVCGLPLSGNDAFLICGSWSILGRERATPLISEDAIQAGFGNEGGVEGRSAFLKSLNGLHLLQKLRTAWSDTAVREIAFSEMSKAASDAAAEGRSERIDPSAPIFFDPPDLIEALRTSCFGQGTPVNNELGTLTLAIYRGLTDDMAAGLSALERLTGEDIGRLRICGGGGQDAFLCRMIAQRTGRTVAVGPIEASAWGNAVLQLIGLGKIATLSEGRRLVENSTEIVVYTPANAMIGL